MRDAGVPEREIRRTLADLCGVRYQAVQQWFSGDTKKISPEHLAVIAKHYKVSLMWLITGEGSKTDQPSDVTEQSLLKAWRTLPPSVKEAVLVQLRAMSTAKRD